ncbi:MAG: imidazolonepropionase [Candidatus Lokiarchaeota archaeon]|nr:imidazolonepropionase [Candidatus Lokiarchaeota archaeon]
MNAFSTPTPKRVEIKSAVIKPKKLEPDIIIVNANQVITMESNYGVPRIGENMSKLGILFDAAVAIQDDKIVFIGKYSDIHTKCSISETTRIIDASNQIVMPGFIDPHTHIIFDGTREDELEMKLSGKTYLEILESGGGILKTVRATRNASIDKLVQNGKKILDTMLEYGTTTIETKSGYGLDVENELKLLRVAKKLDKEHLIDIIPTFMGAHAIPPEYEGKPDDYVDLIINDMIPKITEEHLAEFCDVFCEKGIFSIKQTRRILDVAITFGLKPQIHIDEIEDTNGALLAAELKAVQTGHLLKSNDKGLKAMALEKVIATLLPATPFCLMMKNYAPARKMINFNVPIALATDLNPNAWTESMQMIFTLACYNMKLTPAEVLTAGTINAACAVNRQHYIGSIEIGKQADIVILDIPNFKFLPYRFGINLVSKVIKKGVIVVDNE